MNLLSVIDHEDIDKVHLNETVFISYDIDLLNLESPNIILDHKFRTNNLIIRIYDKDNNYNQLEALIEYLNINQVKIDFSKTIGSGQYRILILATLNNFNMTALPLNDITGFSSSFKLQENVSKYNVNHNLNSYNTFEQIYNKETGELVNVNIDRIDENNIQLSFNKEYVNEHINNEYYLIVFGELDINSNNYLSTIYNTKFENYIVQNKRDAPIILNYDQISNNFKIEYDTNYETMIYDSDYDKKQIVYHIQHNMNNDNIVLQIYDDHNLKVDSYIQIIDKNNIILVVNVPLIYDEKYKINILTLPEENIAPSNYSTIKKSNYFISMYTEILSNDSNDYFDEDIDNGDEFLTDEDFDDEEYDGGNDDSLDIEYIDDANNGDPDSGTSEYDIDTFTINHNLNTTTLLVNVFNNITKETVNTYVAINDENSVTVGFLEKFNNNVDDYKIVIIGALPFNNLNIQSYYDVDSNDLLQPHHYMEYKRYENDTISKHISFDNDFYDMSNEYVTLPISNNNIQININKRDIPTMKERVDIIHEIKLDNNNMAIIKEDINERYGFNEYSILTNDITASNNIKEDTGYRDTLTHIMKVEPLFN